MPDVIITPSSGIIDFYPSGKTASVYASGNDLVFSNSSGNFEIISGNFGIGTTTPSGKLTVIGSGLVSSITGTVPNALLHAYSTVSGDTVFNVEGTNGSLFSIVDSLSGTLMAVNNNAGLPVFEVFSDDSIVAGRFNQNDLVVSSGGNVGMGTASPSGKLDVRGNAYVSGNLGIGIPSPTGQFQVIGTGNINTLNIRQPTNNISAFNIFSSGNAYTHSIYAGSSSYDTVFNFPHTLNCYLNNSAGSFNIYQNSASPTWRFTSTLLQSSFGGASLYAGATGYFGFGTYAGTSNFEVMSIHNRVGNTAWGVGLLYNSGAGLTRGLVLNNIGNVGINTDTPTFQLHVNGSGFIASGLTVTGLLTGNSGNFINSLQLNGTGVSISGHTHTASNITDFNSSVSGLIPVKNVTGSGYVNVSSSSGIYNIAVTGLQPSGNYANSTHSHGNITNDGQIGTAAGLVVTTDINGVLITTAVGDGLVIEDSTLFIDQPYLNSIYAASEHIHGNITNSGAIGSASGLLVITGNSGILTTSSGINSSLISNFNSAVSGLLPVTNILAGNSISVTSSGSVFTINSTASGVGGGGGGVVVENSGNDRILTSTGSSSGINAEANLTFNGSLFTVTGSGNFASGLIINNQTANTITSFDANKNVVSLSTGTYPSLTELSYVKGVTSAIQTQINTKQNTLTNPVTGVGVSGYVSRWTTNSGLSTGILYDNLSGIGIRTISPTAQLHVNGSGYFASGCSITGVLNVQVIKQTVASGTDGATVTFDMNKSNVHTVTLGGNRTLAVSNVDIGQRFTIRLKQDTTPPRTVTWFSGIYWPSNRAPILTRVANAVDVFSFICTASGKYDGYIVGYNFPNA